MTTRYLRERQRAVETVAALYAFSYAAFVAAVITVTDQSPLSWAAFSEADQWRMAWAMMVAGLVHATGIRVNGAWRWSPAARLAGMLLHLSVVLLIASHARPTGTAFLNYCFIAGLLAFGAMSAWQDVRKAVRRGYSTT